MLQNVVSLDSLGVCAFWCQNVLNKNVPYILLDIKITNTSFDSGENVKIFIVCVLAAFEEFDYMKLIVRVHFQFYGCCLLLSFLLFFLNHSVIKVIHSTVRALKLLYDLTASHECFYMYFFSNKRTN